MDTTAPSITISRTHVRVQVLPLLFAAALLLRVVVVLAYAGQMPQRSDPDWYYQTAANAASGHGFTLNGTPTATYTAGYALVLTGLFAVLGQPSVLAAQLLNVLFSMLALLYGYRLVREVLGERPARWALVFMALYPAFIGHSAMLLSEPLHMATMLMGLYWLYRNPRRVLWGSLALAVATVTRPQMSLILPVFWLWCWWSRRLNFREMLRYGTVSMAIAFSLTALWGLHNTFAIGAPVLSTSEGANLWIGNGEGAYGGYRFPPAQPTGFSELQASQWLTAQTMDYVRAHPLETLARIPAKIAALYTTDDFPIWYLPISLILASVTDIAIPLLLVAALLRMGFAVLRRQRIATFALLIPLATAVTASAFFGMGRFNLLALFWIVALAVSARPRQFPAN